MAGYWSGRSDLQRKLRDIVQEIQEHGVDRQVLSPMPELLAYRLEPDDGLALGRVLSDTIARMMDDQPDRFYGLGAVPLQDVELASKELSYVKSLGLQGSGMITALHSAVKSKMPFNNLCSQCNSSRGNSNALLMSRITNDGIWEFPHICLQYIQMYL